MLADDGIVRGVTGGPPVRGPEEFKPFLRQIRGALPDIHFTIEETLAEDDRVAVRWTARASHQGDHLGVPATGKSVEVGGMAFALIRDGKMVDSHNVWDRQLLLQELGLVTPAQPLGA